MAARCYPLPGSGENVVRGVGREGVAVRVPKQFLISAYLLVTR
jgi:hypothetical protein